MLDRTRLTSVGFRETLRNTTVEREMKHVAFAFALSLVGATAASAATPAYSTSSILSVEVQRNCFLAEPQLTAAPYGDGYLIRARNQDAAVVLIREQNSSRAEFYRASDQEGRRLLQALRRCELMVPRPPPVMRNPQRLKP
jgi:hypothetical protein